MKGYFDITYCPNCGQAADIYRTNIPFSFTSIKCAHCGLLINPKISYLTLKKLNILRIDLKLEPLKELPIQSKI